MNIRTNEQNGCYQDPTFYDGYQMYPHSGLAVSFLLKIFRFQNFEKLLHVVERISRNKVEESSNSWHI